MNNLSSIHTPSIDSNKHIDFSGKFKTPSGLNTGQVSPMSSSLKGSRVPSPAKFLRKRDKDGKKLRYGASSASNGPFYNTMETNSKMMSKWNTNLADSLASKKEKLQKMNRGASFFVQPHSLSFNKYAMKANQSNHTRVVSDLHNILERHEAQEAKKLKGLSDEMIAAQKKSKKPATIIRTEAMLHEVNQNQAGNQLRGRIVPKADEALFKRMKKS